MSGDDRDYMMGRNGENLLRINTRHSYNTERGRDRGRIKPLHTLATIWWPIFPQASTLGKRSNREAKMKTELVIVMLILISAELG